MAPKKRSAVEPTTRVTRSSTRRVDPNPDPKPPKAKKPKKSAPPPPAAAPEEEDAEKTIVVEHCKQCNSFKTRALMVKENLEKRVTGLKVVVNPEKPRRGCFEIRGEDGEKFISLLDMKRPFKPMKDLDMDQLVSDIVEKINWRN